MHAPPRPDRSKRVYVDMRSIGVNAPADRAFDPVRRIGGETGWYYANWLWRLRGALDRLAGGPGVSRGRRHPDELQTGDFLDCWRVESFGPGRRLRLVAEMKMPGRGWLEFEVSQNGHGSIIRQTATYEPQGWPGRLYWYLSYPAHRFVFAGMLRGIAARALSR